MSHEWLRMPVDARAASASSQLMTPYWESKSHCQTVIVASTGVPQASSIADLQGRPGRPRPTRGHEHRERDTERASSARR